MKIQHRTWFNLARHDDPVDPPADPPADPDPKPVEPPATGDPKDYKAEAEKWKTLSQKMEARAKDNAAAAVKLAELEAANQTEAEKLAAKADAAEKKASEAIARAVRAEVKALADGFADRDDAVLNLGDLAQYIKDGDVDTASIEATLTEVLTRKPHLAKTAAVPPVRQPAPDPSQGRGGDVKPADFRTAGAEEFAAEAAKYGIRPRS